MATSAGNGLRLAAAMATHAQRDNRRYGGCCGQIGQRQHKENQHIREKLACFSERNFHRVAKARGKARFRLVLADGDFPQRQVDDGRFRIGIPAVQAALQVFDFILQIGQTVF